MINTILDRIDYRLKTEAISAKVITTDNWLNAFKTYKRRRGVYVISEGDQVIYVGKGFFTARNTSHYKKAINEAKYNPKGWIWFKDNVNYSIDKWVLTVVELDSYVDITFMEGALIKDLLPLANDEVFNDRR